MWRRRLDKKKREILKNRIVIRLFLLSIFLTIVFIGILVYFKHTESVWTSPVPIEGDQYAKIKPQKIASKSLISRDVEKLLSEHNIQYESISSASDSSVLVRLAAGEEVVLSSTRDIAFQISSLQLILSRFTIEGKKFQSLDFRFERPIVVLK